MKKTKILLLIIALLLIGFIILFLNNYFKSKSSTKCDNLIPQTCRTCTCSRGFIYAPAPFGSSEIKCLLGKPPTCGTTSGLDH